MEKFSRAYATLVPAYGRDYTSSKSAIADFQANLDFKLEPEGCYINKAQILEGLPLNIRYGKLRKVCVTKS